VTAGDACTVAVVVTAGVTAGAIGTAGGDFEPRDLADAECSHRPMSALGQKQICAAHKLMSASPPIATAKADIRAAENKLIAFASLLLPCR